MTSLPPNATNQVPGKEVLFGNDARQRMLAGASRMAKAVRVTLGPQGRHVVVDLGYGSPRVTKDGVTVAKAIDLSNPVENIGAQLIKEVSQKTNDVAGDGTTTAAILSHSIFQGAVQAVASGVNPMDLRRGVTQGSETVERSLKKQAKQIATQDEIKQVATISANGDVSIGDLIGSAVKRVGKDGVITVEEGRVLDSELDVTEGLRIDQGFTSAYFVTHPRTQTCELSDVSVLLVPDMITSVQPLLPILESCTRESRALLIIGNIEQEALATLLVNKLRGVCKVVAVKPPGFGDAQKAMLEDLAIFTGGRVVSEETGTPLSKAKISDLGKVRKIRVGRDDTILLEGAGSKEKIKERAQMLQRMISAASSEFERDRLKQRLGRLSGGVAVLRVGGLNEVEVGEKKDRVVDALNATHAAIAEGIVPGGGVALLQASVDVEQVMKKERDIGVRAGLELVRNACREPAKNIAKNSGLEGSGVVHRLLNRLPGDGKNLGFDARTGQYVDMFKAGIVDPHKVVRTAIRHSAALASLLAASEAVVCDSVPSKDSQ